MFRFICIICLIAVYSQCSDRPKSQVLVATSANMQFAMEALIEAFEKNSKIDCELIVGSSGKLTAQIKEGAPFHLFVSADMKYPHELHKNGQAHSPPKVYAHGKLVLWTNEADHQLSLNMLTSDSIKHIALANPMNAPYGRAAIEVLKTLNLYEVVEHKLVYGESVSQVNQFLISESADVGFTAKSVVLSPRMKNNGTWVEIDELYSPIEQGAIIIKQEGPVSKDILMFYNYLFSPEAKLILKEFGYSTSE